MTITTATIADRCRHEEAVWADDREFRAQGIEATMEAMSRQEAQLACEAIKFHRIRIAGYAMDETLKMMGIA